MAESQNETLSALTDKFAELLEFVKSQSIAQSEVYKQQQAQQQLMYEQQQQINVQLQNQLKLVTDQLTYLMQQQQQSQQHQQPQQPKPPVHLLDNITRERIYTNQMSVDMEVDQRKAKYNNMVVCNLPELNPPLTVSKSDRSDPANNDELATIRALATQLDIDPTHITGVFRMGRAPDNTYAGAASPDRQRGPRPLKVLCSSADTKSEMMRNQKHLHQAGLKPQVYIRHDLTDHQRDLGSQAQFVLKCVRNANAGDGASYVLRDSKPGQYWIHTRQGNGKLIGYGDPFNPSLLSDFEVDFSRMPKRQNGSG